MGALPETPDMVITYNWVRAAMTNCETLNPKDVVAISFQVKGSGRGAKGEARVLLSAALYRPQTLQGGAKGSPNAVNKPP